MLKLLDGPAKGVYFVKRAPTYLRAVVDPEGKIDVLDQLGDAPRARERVHVYRIRAGTRTWVHINMGSTRRGSGFYAGGDYDHLPEVDGEELRDELRWRAWALAQPPEGA